MIVNQHGGTRTVTLNQQPQNPDSGPSDSLAPGSDDRLAHEARPFRAAQWRMLLATMFCYLFFYTGRQTFGFAIPGIQEELGLSKTTLGWISAAIL